MRPRKKESIKVAKDEVITVRVSKEDKAKYSAEAENYGMNLSKYILHLLNHKKVNVIKGGAEIICAIYDLNCTISKYDLREDISVEELKNAMTTCIENMNRFYEHVQGDR